MTVESPQKRKCCKPSRCTSFVSSGSVKKFFNDCIWYSSASKVHFVKFESQKPLFWKNVQSFGEESPGWSPPGEGLFLYFFLERTTTEGHDRSVTIRLLIILRWYCWRIRPFRGLCTELHEKTKFCASSSDEKRKEGRGRRNDHHHSFTSQSIQPHHRRPYLCNSWQNDKDCCQDRLEQRGVIAASWTCNSITSDVSGDLALGMHAHTARN